MYNAYSQKEFFNVSCTVFSNTHAFKHERGLYFKFPAKCSMNTKQNNVARNNFSGYQ